MAKEGGRNKPTPLDASSDPGSVWKVWMNLMSYGCFRIRFLDVQAQIRAHTACFTLIFPQTLEKSDLDTQAALHFALHLAFSWKISAHLPTQTHQCIQGLGSV